MTTIRQIDKLVKPVTGGGNEFFQKGPYLFHRPVDHIISRIDISRTSNAEHFRVIWHFCPTFGTGFTMEWEMWFLPIPHQLWFWSTPGIHELFVACVHDQILPRLRAARTIEGFVDLLATEPDFAKMGNRLAACPDDEIRVEIARGHLDAALEKCRALEKRLIERPDGYWGPILSRTTEAVRPLLESGDRTTLVDLLRRWERERIAKLDLHALYEPTPFPLERLG
jgi:hypothetical protein